LANYNVISVQANDGFENGNALDLSTSSVDDTAIALGRFFPDTADDTVSGRFELNRNTVTSQTQGNAADLSIFLGAGDAGSFNGSAFVSSTQLSSDSTTPVGDFPGISASTTDTVIVAVFAAEPLAAIGDINPADLLGPAFFLAGDGLTASVDGNAIGSSAAINSARNELGFTAAWRSQATPWRWARGPTSAPMQTQARTRSRPFPISQS
jgi:hypothetical protein